MKKITKSIIIACSLLAASGFAGERCAMLTQNHQWSTGDTPTTVRNCVYSDVQANTYTNEPNHIVYKLTHPNAATCESIVTSTVYVNCGQGSSSDENYLDGYDTSNHHSVSGTIYKNTAELHLYDNYYHVTLDAKNPS